MYENKKKIRFTDTDEVKAFVKAAGKCDFDIDVIYYRCKVNSGCFSAWSK